MAAASTNNSPLATSTLCEISPYGGATNPQNSNATPVRKEAQYLSSVFAILFYNCNRPAFGFRRCTERGACIGAVGGECASVGKGGKSGV